MANIQFELNQIRVAITTLNFGSQPQILRGMLESKVGTKGAKRETMLSINYQLIRIFDRSYLECLPGYPKLARGEDALDLIVACGENNTDKLLLHAENFTDDFYRLRTGVAGEILQKFSTYRIQVAAVLTPELVNQGRFREMVLEANRGNQFRVFYDLESAEHWLVGV